MFPLAVAILFLLAIFVIAPLAMFVVWWRPTGLGPLQAVLWLMALVLVKTLWRTRWVGALPLNDGQGAVIACNHRSSVDPFFIQTATTRKIHWMVAREFCEHPAFGWLLRTCEVIPVNRGGSDTAATKAALRIVERGGLVGMFPEGRINMTDALLLPCRPGAAMIADRAGVPVVPCLIEGSPYRKYPWSPFVMSARVTVQFGDPIVVPPREAGAPSGPEADSTSPAGPEAIMQAWFSEMIRLAGQPDFVPQRAGRSWKPSESELAEAMAAGEERLRRQNR
jgi:1-acyl-sn-glycerol-3-phosphate acyltransferase